MGDPLKSRSPGRPREAATSARVLAVTRHLVADRGYPAVTMSQIATESGVAKQTLYRRWQSKAEVVLDAFLASAAEADEIAYEGLEGTLSRFLSGLFAHLERDGIAIRNLIASAQSDEAFLTRFRERFVQPRAQALIAILSTARDRGELPDELDLSIVSDMIHGAFWYRLLLDTPLDAAYARSLAAAVAGRGPASVASTSPG